MDQGTLIMAEAATQTRYRVEGMDCAACAAKIDIAVRRLPGIEHVAVSATPGSMTVRHNGQPIWPRLNAR
jgi:Cd2+/Zn2+-exporting ATPase